MNKKIYILVVAVTLLVTAGHVAAAAKSEAQPATTRLAMGTWSPDIRANRPNRVLAPLAILKPVGSGGTGSAQGHLIDAEVKDMASAAPDTFMSQKAYQEAVTVANNYEEEIKQKHEENHRNVSREKAQSKEAHALHRAKHADDREAKRLAAKAARAVKWYALFPTPRLANGPTWWPHMGLIPNRDLGPRDSTRSLTDRAPAAPATFINREAYENAIADRKEYEKRHALWKAGFTPSDYDPADSLQPVEAEPVSSVPVEASAHQANSNKKRVRFSDEVAAEELNVTSTGSSAPVVVESGPERLVTALAARPSPFIVMMLASAPATGQAVVEAEEKKRQAAQAAAAQPALAGVAAQRPPRHSAAQVRSRELRLRHSSNVQPQKPATHELSKDGSFIIDDYDPKKALVKAVETVQPDLSDIKRTAAAVVATASSSAVEGSKPSYGITATQSPVLVAGAAADRESKEEAAVVRDAYHSAPIDFEGDAEPVPTSDVITLEQKKEGLRNGCEIFAKRLGAIDVHNALEDYELREFLTRCYPTLQKAFNELSLKDKKVLNSEGMILLRMRALFLNSEAPWNKGLALMKEINALRRIPLGHKYEDEYAAAFKGLITKHCSDYGNAVGCLVNLNWCFYMLAAEQGKPYKQASFRIQDGGRAPLLAFARTLMTIQENAREARDGKRVGQVRMASHLTHIKTPVYGVDIPESERDNPLFKMPNKALHSFFKQINEEWLLVKPEDHGTTNWKDWALHAWGYIESQHRALAGGNEQGGMQKERIPAWATKLVTKLIDLGIKNETWLERFNKMWRSEQSKTSRTAAYLKDFSQQGLQSIPRLLANLEYWDLVRCTQPEYLAAKKELFEKLKPYDSLANRIGNEIELTYSTVENYALPHRGYEIMN